MIFTIFALSKDWLIYILCLVSLSISNANPIQFWLTGQETFNQKEECSIYPVCFCQNIDPSDTVIFDIRDTSDGINYLIVYLDDGSIWSSIFTYTPYGLDHHQHIIINNWSTVIDRKLIFKIVKNLYVLLAPNLWTNGTRPFGSKTSTQFIQIGMSPPAYTAYQAIIVAANDKPQSISLTIQESGSTADITVELGWYDSIGGTKLTSDSVTISSIGSITKTFTFSTISSQANFLQISALSNAPVTVTITLNNIGQIIGIQNTEAISDCVEITSNNNFICTKLITYSNSSDFAALSFPSSSPSYAYNLRIPAVFFDEQFPQEQEDLELSTDEIITLWSKIEGKKLLDIGFMPFYMHLKVQMVLMMDSVSIDGVSYRMRDPYQITPPASKRSALRKAQVLLSDKDFIDRNLL